MPLFNPLPPTDEADCNGLESEEQTTSKAAIHRKLHKAVPKAIRALEQAMQFGEYGEMIRAAQVILDRAGYGPKSVVQIEELPDDLSDMSQEQLAERAETIARLLKSQVH